MTSFENRSHWSQKSRSHSHVNNLSTPKSHCFKQNLPNIWSRTTKHLCTETLHSSPHFQGSRAAAECERPVVRLLFRPIGSRLLSALQGCADRSMWSTCRMRERVELHRPRPASFRTPRTPELVWRSRTARIGSHVCGRHLRCSQE